MTTACKWAKHICEMPETKQITSDEETKTMSKKKKIVYSAWALGYDRDDRATDYEHMLHSFSEDRSAVMEHAYKFYDLGCLFDDPDRQEDAIGEGGKVAIVIETHEETYGSDGYLIRREFISREDLGILDK